MRALLVQAAQDPELVSKQVADDVFGHLVAEDVLDPRQHIVSPVVFDQRGDARPARLHPLDGRHIRQHCRDARRAAEQNALI